MWSLLATALRLLGGVLVLPLVVRRLPSDHLGLWYVFLSLQGIASLFDLGFSPAVTRAAGYLWAGAQQLKKFGVARVPESELVGTKPNYPLLNSMVATMRLYYRFFGVGSGLVMLFAGGAWVWIKTQNLPDATTLRFCYVVFVLGGFLNATGDLWPALLSGINGVRNAQKILVGSALINLIVIAGGLLAHFGIWALVLGTVAAGFYIRWAGRASFFELAGSGVDRSARPQFHLIGQLWPTAWRSGLVSLGGFLVLSANTLICSGFLDLKATATYGLSLSLIIMLNSAASTFTIIKLPIVNQLRAVGQTDDIVELWIQRTRISILFYIVGSLFLLFGGNTALQVIGSKTMFLPTGQLALALLIIGLEMHHSLYGGLIISENQNPFVVPALISGAATVLLSLLLTPRIGVWGMLLAQGVSQACFNNWWTIYRAIRGLGLSWAEYWHRYARRPVHI
jgi:O-antigen/teichoic acid export membrane protein